jgi:endo-1,4-beta-xylanase
LDLKGRGVPITAVGLQAHIDGAFEIDREGVSQFCADMTRAGLEVLVTELDVIDVTFPTEVATRDRMVAEKARAFLEAVLAGCRPKLICTWGITDKYTWMPTWFKRTDGTPNRPLPLDASFIGKPMLDVIRDACRAV